MKNISIIALLIFSTLGFAQNTYKLADYLSVSKSNIDKSNRLFQDFATATPTFDTTTLENAIELHNLSSGDQSNGVQP